MRIPRSAVYQRRSAIARFWLMGQTQREIQILLQKSQLPYCQNVALSTVNHDLKIIEKDLIKRVETKVDDKRNDTISRLYNTLKEAWESYLKANGVLANTRASLLRTVLDIEKEIAKFEGTIPVQILKEEYRETEIEEYEDAVTKRERILQRITEIRERFESE